MRSAQDEHTFKPTFCKEQGRKRVRDNCFSSGLTKTQSVILISNFADVVFV